MKYFLSEAFDIYWKRRVKRENNRKEKKNKQNKIKHNNNNEKKSKNESKFCYTFYKCGRLL